MTIFRTIAVYVALSGSLAFGVILPARCDIPNLKAAEQAMATRDYARAATLFTNVLQGDRLEAAMLARVYYERGMAQHELGSLTHAVSDYTNAIWLGALSPTFEAKVFLARAVAELEGNQIARAGTDFDSAIAKDPDLADAYLGRATVRRLQGELEAAIEDYDKAIALHHPAPALVYYGRALANEAAGQSIAAGRDFTAAVKAEPDFAPARTKLIAMGLPVPPQEGLGVMAAPRKPDPMSPITVADAPGLEVALGLGDSGEEATASLAMREDGAGASTEDPLMDAIAETGTSHVPAPDSTETATAAEADSFLRPPAEGLLDGSKSAEAVPPPPDVKIASAGMAPVEEADGSLAPPPAPAEETSTASSAPVPVTPAPAPPVTVAEAAPASPTPAPEEKIAAVLPPPPAEPKKVVSVQKDKGGFYVQIASFQQKELAEKGRLSFGARFPEIAAQVPPSIMSADLGNLGTVYRLRLGPLESATDSANLCATLKKNGQDCIVVPPKHPAG